MIKDQCNNCKKYNTSNCGQTIVYNGFPCELYAKKLDLSKPSDCNSSYPSSQPNSIPQSQTSCDNTTLTSNNASVLTTLFSFNGRRRRSHYLLTIICANLPLLPANLSSNNMSEGVAVFTLLIILPVLWILLANATKRCHDLGKSGWLALGLFVPLLNLIIGVYLLFFKGDTHDNEYGPSPY